MVFSTAYLRPANISGAPHPLTSRGLRFPPLISREKHGGLPPAQKRPHEPCAPFFVMFNANNYVLSVVNGRSPLFYDHEMHIPDLFRSS